MPKYCSKGQSCAQEAPCADVCTSPLCGDPSLLPMYAPLIYDEMGVNVCQTLTVTDPGFAALSNAEKAFVQVLDVSFADSEAVSIPGRPNCTEITLQNLTVSLLIRLYSASGQLLGGFTQSFTYLPPVTDPSYDEDTNPSSVTFELFTPYGISYDAADASAPRISYMGFLAANQNLTQGLNAIAYPKVLDLNVPAGQITVGLTVIVSCVYFSQYLVPHQGKVRVPKGSLLPEDDSLCLNFVNGDLLEMTIKPLELGPPRNEEFLKNDCSQASSCCSDSSSQNNP
ncbi:MAG: hypothetical protein Q4C82_06590 [Eubacteriales bacterium]|nr:hypothetical protein [Eubacteriales bacterium]